MFLLTYSTWYFVYDICKHNFYMLGALFHHDIAHYSEIPIVTLILKPYVFCMRSINIREHLIDFDGLPTT